MAKFCGKCGARLDEATGLCPNCAPAKAPQEEPKKEELKKEEPKKVESKKEKPKKEKKNRKRLTKKAKLLLIIGAAVIVLALVIGVLFLFGGEETKDSEEDAGAYYKENSYIVDVIDAKKSTSVPEEKDAIELLQERGFTQYPIMTEYNMDGDFEEEKEISDNSTERHPIYYTYYINSQEEIWMIYVINGAVMATPVSYNLQSSLGVEVTFAESEEITSYDSMTNQFYVTIPNEDVLIVRVVDQINADTLEWFSIWEIENYGE